MSNVLVWKLRNLPNWLRGLPLLLLNKAFNNVAPEARLYLQVQRANGRSENYGMVSNRVVTTAGVNAIVDAFQGSFTLANFKYHGSGTGAVAENVSDTALGGEVETRATGSQGEGAGANVYRTQGTISYTATRAITEHGVFSATTSGTLLDRSVFAAINVNNGDSISGALAA
jgi:hypothetical protein